MAKPMPYAEKIGSAICERLMDGESLKRICEDAKMPSRVTVFKWIRESEEFANNYARAREEQAESYADEITQIADCAKPEDAAVARLQIDARKWVASKLKPKRYGDKITHAGEGEGGAHIIQVMTGIVRADG